MRVSGNHTVFLNRETMKTTKQNKKKASTDAFSHFEKLVIEKKYFSDEEQLKETIHQIITNFGEENNKD